MMNSSRDLDWLGLLVVASGMVMLLAAAFLFGGWQAVLIVSLSITGAGFAIAGLFMVLPH